MANDSNKIEIEITLSDGTIQKAQIDLEKALKKGGKDGGEGAADNFSSMFSKRLIAGGAIAAVGAAFKKIFDFTIAGEQIKQISAQFELLSSRAGVSGKALRAALTEASGGLIDNEAVMKSASKALLELGESANRLPEIMKLAKQATSLFGGEVVDKFEMINQAIASGQTRGLKQIGIFIDQEKALKDYARSLGVSANALDQTGRQQAILNAVLTKGGDAFKGINSELTPVTNGSKKLGVSMGELGDKIAIAVEGNFGEAIKKIISGVGAAADATASAIARASGTEQLEDKIARLSKEYKFFSNLVNSPVTEKGQLPEYQSRLRAIQTELSAASKAAQAFESIVNRKGDTMSGGPKSKVGGINQDVVAQERSQSALLLQATKDGLMAAQQAKISLMVEGNAKEMATQQFHKDEMARLDAEYAVKKKELESQLALENYLSKDQELMAIENLEKEYRLRKEAEELKAAAKQKAMQDQLNSTLRSGLAQAISQGIQTFVGALMKGQNAFKAFAGAMVGALGDIAVNVGNMMILQGITIEAAKVLGGGQMIAAGAALVALGSVMKGFSGGLDAGGGVSASGGGLASTDSAPSQAKPEKETSVQVVVQGNILDRRETGLAIAETLNEFFNTSDGRLVRTA